MKLILWVLLSFSVSLSMARGSVNDSNGFVITGTVKGLPNGALVYLVKYNEQIEPTEILETRVQNNKFEMTGKVDTPYLAYILVRGQDYGFPVFLENVAFSIDISKDLKSCKLTGGGDDQKLADRFDEMDKNRYDCLLDFGNQYEKMYKKEHLETDQVQLTNWLLEQKKFLLAWDSCYQALVTAHADSYVTASFLCNRMHYMELGQLTRLFNSLSDKGKSNMYGGMLSRVIKRRQEDNRIIQDVKMQTPEGKEMGWHEVKGKVKLLDFWASWCGPCRHSSPQLVALHALYGSKGLEIVGISLDKDKEAWKKAIEQDGLQWLQLSNLNGWECPLYREMQSDGIPLWVLLDENNKVIVKDVTIAELVKVLDGLLR